MTGANTRTGLQSAASPLLAISLVTAVDLSAGGAPSLCIDRPTESHTDPLLPVSYYIHYILEKASPPPAILRTLCGLSQSLRSLCTVSVTICKVSMFSVVSHCALYGLSTRLLLP